MRLTAELSYAADPAEVFAMLTDPAFQERKLAATGALAHHVSIEPHGPGTVVRTRRELPTDPVPEPFRGMVGPRLIVVQVEEWGPAGADGGRQGRLSAEVAHAPLRMTGTLRLTAVDGGTREDVVAEVKARIPMIGGRLEKAIEPALRAAIDVEGRTGVAWLAGQR